MKKPKVVLDEPNRSRLAERLEAAMQDRGMTLGDLQKELDKRLPDGCTYETVRRYINTSSAPSLYVLQELCKVLKLSFPEMSSIMRTDKLQKEYGDLLPALTQKKPGIEPLERLWDQLSGDQQTTIVAMARELAKRTRGAQG